jgi:3-hydroxyacyl-CoA dehydrogenase
MNLRAFAFAAILLLAACSKITQDNFARIQDGMSEQEVTAILGSPTESSSTSVLNMTGTASRWADKETVIVVRFVNGKVVLKTFDKQPTRK